MLNWICFQTDQVSFSPFFSYLCFYCTILQWYALVIAPKKRDEKDGKKKFHTAKDRIELSMGAAKELEFVADRVYGLAKQLQVTDSISALIKRVDFFQLRQGFWAVSAVGCFVVAWFRPGAINELLVLQVQSVTGDYWQTACDWLKLNRVTWEPWVPDKTACSIGRGLVDLQGAFVTLRSDAVDCAICPAGRASTESGDTRVCSQCAPGSYQSTFGTSECSWSQDVHGSLFVASGVEIA